MNDFDLWNILKQKIDATWVKYGSYAKEGDVWIASLGRNIGAEENGKGLTYSRPVLIVKKFNKDTVWVLALSSKQKNINYYFNFIDPLNKPRTAILSQLRVISTKRLNRKLYRFTGNHLQGVKSILKSYL